MPGGRREGSGRKLGSANKKSREIADRAAEEGITPLEYMLQVMRAPMPPELEERLKDTGQVLSVDVIQALSNWHHARFEAAKAAAPFIHPRLQAIEHTGKDGGPMEIDNVSDTEAARRVAFVLRKGMKGED